MALSKLRAVLSSCALGVSALTAPRGVLRMGQPEEGPLPNPVPMDLVEWEREGWGAVARRRALDGEIDEPVPVQVDSLVTFFGKPGPKVTIVAFDKWLDQEVTGHLLAGEGWEAKHTKHLCSLFSKKGGVGNFLDVGANIGTFSIPMADCLKYLGSYRGGGDSLSRSKVISVEGMPQTVDHLVAGITANNMKNVDVYNYAVGGPNDPRHVTMSLNPVNKGGSAVKGNKPFTEMDDDQLQDLFHPKKKTRQDAKKVEVQEVSVELTTGDNILSGNTAMKAIMIAKVDIEGHEGHFIKGSQLLFSEYPPCIMTIELVPEWLERAGTPTQEVLDSLTSWGYNNVPTIEQLSMGPIDSKTRTLEQKDMDKCIERVTKYALEQPLQPI